MYHYGKTSQRRIATGTTELQSVIHLAMEIANTKRGYCPDISILEVYRTPAKQRKLFKLGRVYKGTHWEIVSKKDVVTYCDGYDIPSSHQSRNAVDFGAYIHKTLNYKQSNLAHIATCFMQAANDLNLQFKWGGQYASFYDGGHFNLINN